MHRILAQDCCQHVSAHMCKSSGTLQACCERDNQAVRSEPLSASSQRQHNLKLLAHATSCYPQHSLTSSRPHTRPGPCRRPVGHGAPSWNRGPARSWGMLQVTARQMLRKILFVFWMADTAGEGIWTSGELDVGLQISSVRLKTSQDSSA